MTERDKDLELVIRAQGGDKAAFALLVTKYQRKVARLLSTFLFDRSEVEDVTQEAFIRAYRSLHTFRGDSAFYTWLYRVAINAAKRTAADARKKGAIRAGLDPDTEIAELFDEKLRDNETPERILASKQVGQRVQAALEKLPQELRIAITLREIEGLSYEEIALIMDCPLGTVRSRIFRARQAVSNHLHPLIGDEKPQEQY